jgi:hypothetical protein
MSAKDVPRLCRFHCTGLSKAAATDVSLGATADSELSLLTPVAANGFARRG